MLLIAFYDPNGIPTIVENIESWARLSKFEYELLNLFEGYRGGPFKIPNDINLKKYDGIVIHCTVSFNIRNLLSLDELHHQKLADFKGLKVIFKQDEHYKLKLIADYIASHDFHGVITMCSPQDLETFYPKQKVGNIKFVHALTGYVSQNMLDLRYPLTDERPIDVGYRGSIQPITYGHLAYEKREIGDRFLQVCKDRGLRCDISSRWEDRITGQGWFDFLGRLKGVLGVESGASIIDFEGEVENELNRFVAANPEAPYQLIYDQVLKKYDFHGSYKSLSPRHFEAAATKTVQILYEGDYSGILVADRHYLPLRRDFANIDDVLMQFHDPAVRRRLTEAAYEEVILNPKYQYPAFVADVDTLCEQWFDGAR